MAEAERAVVVTGANRGIGRAIAEQLAARAWHVLLTSRGDDGRDVADALQRGGGRASWFALDVTDADSIAAFAQQIEARGGVHALINNAGVALDGFDGEVARQTIDTNVLGPLHLTDALLPTMPAHARVVMVSSGMGDRSALSGELREVFRRPMSRAKLLDQMERFVDDVTAGRHAKAGWPSSAYRVSKIGLNKLTEIYAAELAGDPRGIAVNAACPGWVRTSMGGAGAPRSPEQGAATPVWLAELPEGAASGGFYRDEAPASW